MYHKLKCSPISGNQINVAVLASLALVVLSL
jgi:hypothetical protein